MDFQWHTYAGLHLSRQQKGKRYKQADGIPALVMRSALVCRAGGTAFYCRDGLAFRDARYSSEQ